ncbi:hypothetical protein KW795_01510 [Candidatus Microgenomates bacterium]|nr:hypothetical protein [Candidatus Microgenomates bacterium]
MERFFGPVGMLTIMAEALRKPKPQDLRSREFQRLGLDSRGHKIPTKQLLPPANRGIRG